MGRLRGPAKTAETPEATESTKGRLTQNDKHNKGQQGKKGVYLDLSGWATSARSDVPPEGVCTSGRQQESGGAK